MGRAVGSEAAGRFDRAFYLRNLLPDFAQRGWEEGVPSFEHFEGRLSGVNVVNPLEIGKRAASAGEHPDLAGWPCPGFPGPQITSDHCAGLHLGGSSCNSCPRASRPAWPIARWHSADERFNARGNRTPSYRSGNRRVRCEGGHLPI